MSDSRSHRALDRWQFDASVVSCFDDMLDRSIPEYRRMRQVVSSVGSEFVREHTDVLDLGSSTGEAIEALKEAAQLRGILGARFYGYEVAPAMVSEARKRFERSSSVDIRAVDIAQSIPRPSEREVSLITLVLTLQFIPITARQRVLSRCFEILDGKGALILVEKVIGDGDEIDRMLVRLYHAMKSANGYREEEILRKAASLEGVLSPLTSAWNEAAIRTAGFRRVECVWRYLNFSAWVATP